MGVILKTISDTHPLRRALRYKLFKPDVINIAGEVLRVHILDLSSGGALVYAASPPVIGTRLKLALGARGLPGRSGSGLESHSIVRWGQTA